MADARVPDARHRAVACFYGLLSVVAKPIARFVALRHAVSDAQSADSDVRSQLQCVCDIFARQLKQAARDDAELLVGVLDETYSFCAPASVPVVAFAAVERLLVAVGSDADAQRQARALCELLGVDDDGNGSATTRGCDEERRELVYQALCLLKANGDGASEAHRKGWSILAEALERSQTPRERLRIHLLRSEVSLRAGRRELAYEDAKQVLTGQSLSKNKAMRLATVLIALDRWGEAAAAYDLGLVTHPDDFALQEAKKKVLQNVESWDGNENVSWDRIITKSPVVSGAVNVVIDDDGWLEPLDGENKTEEGLSSHGELRRLTQEDLEQWGARPHTNALPQSSLVETTTELRLSVERGKGTLHCQLTPSGSVGGSDRNSRADGGGAFEVSASVGTPLTHVLVAPSAQKRKAKDIRKDLIKKANVYATSSEVKNIEHAIALLSEALDLAASKKQRAKIRCLRAELYHRIGSNDLAYRDAEQASQVPKLKSSVAVRVKRLMAVLARSSTPLERCDPISQPRPCEDPMVETQDQLFEHSEIDTLNGNVVRNPHDEVRHGDDTEVRGSTISRTDYSVGSSFYVGGFHALLAVLQPALATYVAQRRAEGPPLEAEEEKKHKNLQKAGVKMQLQFVKDHWATHFRVCAPASLLQDLKTINQVYSQSFYAATVKRESYTRGIQAIERLLATLDPDEDTWQRVRMIKSLMISVDDTTRVVGLRENHQPLEAVSLRSQENDDSSCSKSVSNYDKMSTEHGGTAQENPLSSPQSEVQESEKRTQEKGVESDDAECVGDLETLTYPEPDTPGMSANSKLRMGAICSASGKPIASSRVNNLTQSNVNGHPIGQPVFRGEQSAELRKALERVARRDFGNAIHSINQELARPKSNHDNDSSLFVLRARCRYELKQYKAVLKDAQEALALDASSDGGQYWASVALGHLGSTNGSNTSAEKGKVIDLSAEHLNVQHNPPSDAPKLDEPPSASSSTLTFQHCSEEAVRLFETGQHAQAAEWCSRGIELVTREADGTRNLASAFVRRGQCYLAMGHHEMALEDADQALRLRQFKYAKASMLRITTLSALGRHIEALETCVLALIASPELPSLLEHQKALVDKVILTTAAPGSRAERKRLLQEGLAQQSAGELECATRTFTAALQCVGSHQQAAAMYLHRAKCYMSLEHYEQAVQDACMALVVPAMKLSASKILSEALAAQGNLDAASMVCSSALREFPADAPLLKVQEQISTGSGGKHSEKEGSVISLSQQLEPQIDEWVLKQQELMAAALALVTASDFKAADKIFDQALLHLNSVEGTADPSAIIARRIKLLGHKARIAHQAKSFEMSVELARRGLALDRGWVEGHRIMCRALISLGRWSEALPVCESVLDLAPEDVNFRTLQEQIASKVPQAVSTKPAVSTPMSIHKKNLHTAVNPWQMHVRGLLHTGLTLLEKKKTTEAEARFTDGLVFLNKPEIASDTQVDGFRIKLLGHRARCRITSGKYEAAAKDAQMGIAQREGWVEGYRLLCRARMGQGAWHLALGACNEVLTRVPRDVVFAELKAQLRGKSVEQPGKPSDRLEVQQNSSKPFKKLLKQAVQLVKQQQYAVAAACCTNAIDLLLANDFDDVSRQLKASVYINRARCHADAGAFELMLDDARTGQGHNPQWIETYQLECTALVELGRWQEAKIACAKVLSQAPDDETFLAYNARIDEHLQFDNHLVVQTTSYNPSDSIYQGANPPSDTGNATVAVSPVDNVNIEQHAGVPYASIPGVSPPHRMVSVGNLDEEADSRMAAFASGGSIVAQRYTAAQRLLCVAQGHLESGELKETFESARDALSLWPRLKLSHTPLRDLMFIGQQDAVAWGGPMLIFTLQAQKTGFGNIAAELDFWTKRVERYPKDPDLLATLADVHYRAGDAKRSLHHIDGAIKHKAAATAAAENSVPTSWWYLRARCLPSKADSPTHWIHSLFSKASQPNPTREDEYLAFIQRACNDDEWMPHACYSLGVYYLNKKDIARAKQLHFLAETAESRRSQVGLFPPVDDMSFQDKKTLNEAFQGSRMVLSLADQRRAIQIVEHDSGFWQCALCGSVAARVDEFAVHKTTACSPSSPKV